MRSSEQLQVRGGIIAMSLIFTFLWGVSTAYAVDRYWVGAGNNENEIWENADNWSADFVGVGGATVPGVNDLAIMAATGSTVRMGSDVSIGGLFLVSTWTGTLLQGTGGLTIGRDGFRVGSGSFFGAAGPITSSGGFTMTGGIVVGSYGVFSQSGAISITDGGGTGIPSPSFTSTGTFTLAGDAQSVR